jgi:hypothetical protein
MNRFARAWLHFRRPALVTISRWGELTPRPQVSVCVQSERGSQSAYTFDANDQGEASATMYGRTLAHILGVRLIDQRSASITCSRRLSPRSSICTRKLP